MAITARTRARKAREIPKEAEQPAQLNSAQLNSTQLSTCSVVLVCLCQCLFSLPSLSLLSLLLLLLVHRCAAVEDAGEDHDEQSIPFGDGCCGGSRSGRLVSASGTVRSLCFGRSRWRVLSASSMASSRENFTKTSFVFAVLVSSPVWTVTNERASQLLPGTPRKHDAGVGLEEAPTSPFSRSCRASSGTPVFCWGLERSTAFISKSFCFATLCKCNAMQWPQGTRTAAGSPKVPRGFRSLQQRHCIALLSFTLLCFLGF